ncbi:MAG: hypothetical protein HC851_07745 [Acaryochloris sp. RU_4_1]|nr:hypothetical protein [Acaryochloris sp. SU_5_25]NJM65561.1 hypothetical protein [Acaryochloris sp. RU_4_1]
MPSRDSKYYFGRLNIVSAYEEEKKQFLEHGLNSGVLISERNYTWGFFEIESVVEQDDYLSGFLVKYRPLDPEQFVNTETREIEEQEIRNRITAKLRFFLHIRTGIIAYQVVSQINEKSFRENFAKLLEASYNNLFIDAEVQAINQEESFFEAVKSFDSIAKVSIYLHPSNPSSRDIWKRVDERFKNLGLESYTEVYKLKADRSNLDIEGDEEINSKLHMASDGYGKAKVRGKKDGEYETVTTGDNPIEAEVENSVENTERPQEILKQILPTFRSLFNRIRG